MSSTAAVLLTVVVAAALVALHSVEGAASGEWSYANVAQWPRSFPTCGGSRQSPVSVETDASITDSSLPAEIIRPCCVMSGVRAIRASAPHDVMQLEFDVGTAAPCTATAPASPSAAAAVAVSAATARVGGGGGGGGGEAGPTAAPLRLAAMRIHNRSEHVVDGLRADAELQLVFEAASSGRIAMVIAVLVQGGAADVAAAGLLDFLMTAGAAAISSPSRRPDITQVPSSLRDASFVSALLPSREYFTYEGSLTEPPCTEAVQWILFKGAVRVQPSSLLALSAAFAAVGAEQFLRSGNTRPLQPLNARPVLRHSARGGNGTPSPEVVPARTATRPAGNAHTHVIMATCVLGSCVAMFVGLVLFVKLRAASEDAAAERASLLVNS